MPIYSDSFSLRHTAAEPMTATVTYENGIVIRFGPVTIPSTYINMVGILHWQMAACVGETRLGKKPSLIVFLPIENTVFKLAAMTMMTLAINAPAIYIDGSGTWQGIIAFPACKINVLSNPMMVEAITASGVLRNDTKHCSSTKF